MNDYWRGIVNALDALWDAYPQASTEAAATEIMRVVEKAIAAERERCAKIADEHAAEFEAEYPDRESGLLADEFRNFAAAIRKGE